MERHLSARHFAVSVGGAAALLVSHSHPVLPCAHGPRAAARLVGPLRSMFVPFDERGDVLQGRALYMEATQRPRSMRLTSGSTSVSIIRD